MRGVRAIGLSGAAIGAGLALAGCGGGAAPTTSTPNAHAVSPNFGQRCTQVYCVPQAVPLGPANGPAPKPPTVQPNRAERCTQVYCVPEPVPRRPASFTTPG